MTPEEAQEAPHARGGALTESVRKKPAHFDWARTEPACFDWPVVAPNELRARREARAGYCLIDWDGVDALKEWQQHRCAVCGFDQDKLVVDHDHRTALVRGLLCSLCNHRKGQGGGALFDAYRARPPAVLLGVEEVYWSSWGGYYAEPASRATPSQ